MKCERCGQESAIIMFDSSTGDEYFCDDCHRKEMVEYYEKKNHMGDLI